MNYEDWLTRYRTTLWVQYTEQDMQEVEEFDNYCRRIYNQSN